MNKPRRVSSAVLKKIEARRDPVEYEKTIHKLRLAARIADAMQMQGITKSELAKRMGKNPSEITKWLSGTNNFTTDILLDISKELKVQLINDDRIRPGKRLFFTAEQTSKISHSKVAIKVKSYSAVNYKYHHLAPNY
ncbi:helix-turn-helix domain-containing protein [Alistipes sp. OttesenSCG-928-L06]|nr:helix-turn-helix domain-containing protein [Alistipes sp. OttesenSCG-928-L06]